MYDVLVLGGQMGGLVAASLLAKKGLKVAWLEHDGMEDAYEYEGYLFPYAPSVLPSLKDLPIFEAVVEELGLTEEVQRGLKPNHPSLQWVLPRHRLDLSPEPSALHAELHREFPKSATALEEGLLQWSHYHAKTDDTFKTPHLPSMGFWENFKLKRAFRSLKAGPVNDSWVPQGLLSLRQGFLPFLQYSAQSTGHGPQLRPLSQVLLTSYHYPLGRQGLSALFREKFVAMEGRVFPKGTFADELLVDGSRVFGARVTQGNEEVLAKTVLVATDSGALRRLVKNEKWHRRMESHGLVAEVDSFQLALNWVVPRSALPMGMGELLFVAEQNEASPLLVQVSPARKANSAKEEVDEVNVCAGTFVPAKLRGRDTTPIQDSLHGLVNRLNRLLPFSDKSVKHMSSPYLHARRNRASRLMPHPLFRPRTTFLPEVGGLSMKTPSSNLILTNREVLPALGFEGELLTGRKAALWAESKARENG